MADLRGDNPDDSDPYRSLFDPHATPMNISPGTKAGRVPAGLISVEELGHEPPKAARKCVDQGIRLAAKGDHRRAAAEFEKAVGLDRDFVLAHDRLGVEYAQLGRLTEAESELRGAVVLQPRAVGPAFDLSVLLYRKGDFQEAERAVRHVLYLSPTIAPARLLLGMILVGEDLKSNDGIAQIRYAARTMPEAQEILEKLLK
jgi:Flp pilus assembly protein TadD